jgi:membrane-bound lytic murein transglycosylase B
MTVCSKCGHNNVGGKFCVKCGTRLSTPNLETQSQRGSLQERAGQAEPEALPPSTTLEQSVSRKEETSSSAVPDENTVPHETSAEPVKKNLAIAAAAIVVLILSVVIYQMLKQPPAVTTRVDESQTGESEPKPSSASSDKEATISQSVQPKTWKITYDNLFTREGEPRTPIVAQLIADLESENGDGLPVTKQEFMTMLSKPEAEIVYHQNIMRYATPLSLDIQKKEHEDYTKIFMRENYQKAGLEFLRNQSAYLEKAEREYGVLRRDIVSVLIWESGLGKFTGDFREVNVFLGLILFLDEAQQASVSTMVAEGKPNPLDDPVREQKEKKRLERRKKESVTNLVALLRMSKKLGTDPLEMKGSWGGAIGYVQFMPSNLKYAVDGDGDSKVDLSTWPDAIMSVASYLKTLGGYQTVDSGRKRALLKYNPSKEYADGVMLVAETIWKRHVKGE